MNVMNTSDNNQHLENMLAEQLDHLIRGGDTRFMRAKAPADALDLFLLAEELNGALAPMEPSPEFLTRLYGEFIDESPATLLLRWRKLPPSYRLAARIGGFTLTAGIALIAARRGLGVLSGARARQEVDSDSALSAQTLS